MEKGIFSLGYPCVNSTLMSDFPNPSPLVPLIWHADNFATIWNSSWPSLGTISSAQQMTKDFCLNLSNLTHNNGIFLDTRLIHVFVKERLTFATIHNKVWLPVPTYSLSNVWYVMCGDNVLKIDVKKTLENGGENGMIEESVIIISHSTRPGVCLPFKITPLFFLFFLCFFFCFVFFILNRLLSLDNASARYGLIVTYLIARASSFCCTLSVFSEHGCNASAPVKFD